MSRKWVIFFIIYAVCTALFTALVECAMYNLRRPPEVIYIVEKEVTPATFRRTRPAPLPLARPALECPKLDTDNSDPYIVNLE